MRRSTLHKLGIGIGVFSGGLSTIIMYSEGELSKAFTYFGILGGISMLLLLWAVGIGGSMLVARHLSHTIGTDE